MSVHSCARALVFAGKRAHSRSAPFGVGMVHFMLLD